MNKLRFYLVFTFLCSSACTTQQEEPQISADEADCHEYCSVGPTIDFDECVYYCLETKAQEAEDQTRASAWNDNFERELACRQALSRDDELHCEMLEVSFCECRPSTVVETSGE